MSQRLDHNKLNRRRAGERATRQERCGEATVQDAARRRRRTPTVNEMLAEVTPLLHRKVDR